MLKKEKVYDLKVITLKKTKSQYHSDLHQLTATAETMMKEKQMFNSPQKEFNVMKN